MSFNYYPVLDQFFKRLYGLNQTWFEHRSRLSQAEQKTLFDAVILIDGMVQEMHRMLNQKRALPEANAHKENIFGSTASPG